MNQIRKQISQLIQDVMDGNESACQTHSILKELEQTIESGLKVIQGEVMNEARDYEKGEVYHGGTWTFRNTATYLDFSQDNVYTDLNGQASARKKELNAAWKASQSGKGFFDSETGEEVPILPVKTPAKEIIVFKPK